MFEPKFQKKIFIPHDFVSQTLDIKVINFLHLSEKSTNSCIDQSEVYYPSEKYISFLLQFYNIQRTREKCHNTNGSTKLAH